MMSAGFASESDAEHRSAAIVGMAFAVIYTVLIMLVYFAQITTVRLEPLTAQAKQILDYSHGSLMFNMELYIPYSIFSEV